MSLIHSTLHFFPGCTPSNTHFPFLTVCSLVVETLDSYSNQDFLFLLAVIDDDICYLSDILDGTEGSMSSFSYLAHLK